MEFYFCLEKKLVRPKPDQLDCLLQPCFGHTRLPSNHECFPANYSLGLHTAKLFHLKQFTIYGIRISTCSLQLLYKYTNNEGYI